MVPELPRLSSACPWQGHSRTTFAGRSSWCRSSSGPWHPTHSAGGTTAAHVTVAADRPWSYHHSPFRNLRTSLMPLQPGSASASPLGRTSTARVLRKLDIEFEPTRHWTRQFLRSLLLHGNSRRLAPATGRARLTLQRAQTSAAARHLPVRSLRNLKGSHLEPRRGSCAFRSNRRARVDQGGPKHPCLRLARLRHGNACCKHERRYVDHRSSMRGRATEYTLTGQRSLASSCPTPRHTAAH